jgi:hypothetical protein
LKLSIIEKYLNLIFLKFSFHFFFLLLITFILIQKMKDLSDETKILIYFMPIYVIITAGVFLLNLYILVIILMNKKMHISVNFFIAAVCACSLIMAIVCMPLQMAVLLKGFNWSFGFTVCKFWYIVDFTTCSTSFLLLVFISFIRYKSIVNPHSDWAPKKIQILIFCLIWIVPLTIWSIIFSEFLSDDMSEEEINKCLLIMEHNVDDISVSFLFLLPLIILIGINIKIIFELKKRSMKIFNKKCIKDENSLSITQIENLEYNDKSKFKFIIKLKILILI